MAHSALGRYIVRRLLYAIPTLIGVSIVIFLMVRLIPGDPARLIAGLQATSEEVERLRVELGLDRPLYEQYLRFGRDIFSGDLGISAATQTSVALEIGSRFGATFSLAVTGTIIATTVGLIAGIISATSYNSLTDYAVMAIALFGVSVPVFWLGIMLMLIFAVGLNWLPAGGYGGPAHLILPSITLAAFSTAIIARMTRSSLLETLNTDFVRTARAKGLPERLVVARHALRNALIPVITVVGLQFGALLGGAVLTETTFAWPGLGRLLVSAITARDYPVIQGSVLVFATLFVVVNLGVDILYAYVDPRIHYD